MVRRKPLAHPANGTNYKDGVTEKESSNNPLSGKSHTSVRHGEVPGPNGTVTNMGSLIKNPVKYGDVQHPTTNSADEFNNVSKIVEIEVKATDIDVISEVFLVTTISNKDPATGVPFCLPFIFEKINTALNGADARDDWFPEQIRYFAQMVFTEDLDNSSRINAFNTGFGPDSLSSQSQSERNLPCFNAGNGNLDQPAFIIPAGVPAGATVPSQANNHIGVKDSYFLDKNTTDTFIMSLDFLNIFNKNLYLPAVLKSGHGSTPRIRLLSQTNDSMIADSQYTQDNEFTPAPGSKLISALRKAKMFSAQSFLLYMRGIRFTDNSIRERMFASKNHVTFNILTPIRFTTSIVLSDNVPSGENKEISGIIGSVPIVFSWLKKTSEMGQIGKQEAFITFDKITLNSEMGTIIDFNDKPSYLAVETFDKLFPDGRAVLSRFRDSGRYVSYAPDTRGLVIASTGVGQAQIQTLQTGYKAGMTIFPINHTETPLQDFWTGSQGGNYKYSGKTTMSFTPTGTFDGVPLSSTPCTWIFDGFRRANISYHNNVFVIIDDLNK